MWLHRCFTLPNTQATLWSTDLHVIHQPGLFLISLAWFITIIFVMCNPGGRRSWKALFFLLVLIALLYCNFSTPTLVVHGVSPYIIPAAFKTRGLAAYCYCICASLRSLILISLPVFRPLTVAMLWEVVTFWTSAFNDRDF